MPSPDHTSQTSTLSYPLVSSLRNSKAFPTWFQPTTKMLHLTFRIKYALLLKCRHSLLPSLLCQQRSVSQSCGFSSGHVRMWQLDYKESWVPKHWCFWTVVLEKSLESPLDCKEIQPVHPKGKSVPNIHWKDWCWSWSLNTLATWCEELTHLKRPCCWERLKAGGEGDDRGWDGWMASPTQWTWV